MLFVRRVNGVKIALWVHQYYSIEEDYIFELAGDFALLPVDDRFLLLDSRGRHHPLLFHNDDQVAFEIYEAKHYLGESGPTLHFRRPMPRIILELKGSDIPCYEGESPLWDFLAIKDVKQKRAAFTEIIATLRILGVRNTDTEQSFNAFLQS